MQFETYSYPFVEGPLDLARVPKDATEMSLKEAFNAERIYKESGTPIKGEVTSGLLLSIFNPGSPLHDGAVILQNTLVEAAGCILPLTESEMITPDMGTRHRAALGLTEETDAIVIVVSEERGAIAAAEDGRFVNLDMDEMSLRRFLNERLFISSGD